MQEQEILCAKDIDMSARKRCAMFKEHKERAGLERVFVYEVMLERERGERA